MWKKIHKHRALYSVHIEHWAPSSHWIPLFLCISFAAAAIPFSCNNFYNFFFVLFRLFIPFAHFFHSFVWWVYDMNFFCIEWYETWIEAFVQNSARKRRRLSFNILLDPSVERFIRILNEREEINRKKYMRRFRTWQ